MLVLGALSVLLSPCFGSAWPTPANAFSMGETASDASIDRLARAYEIDGWESFRGPLLDQWVALGPFPAGADPEATVWSCWTANDDESSEVREPEVDRTEAGRVWTAVGSPGAAVDLSGLLPEPGQHALLVTYINQRSEAQGGRPTRLNLSAHGVVGDAWVGGRCVATLTEETPRAEKQPLALRVGWNRLVLRLERVRPTSESAEGPSGPVRVYAQLIGPEEEPTPWWYRLGTLPDHQREFWDRGYPPEGRIWVRAEQEMLDLLFRPHPAYSRDLALLRARARRAGADEVTITKLGLTNEVARLLVMGGDPAAMTDRFEQISIEVRKLPGTRADNGKRWLRVGETLSEIRPWLARETKDARTWHCFVTAKHGDYAELWRRYGTIRQLLLDLASESRQVLREVSAR